MVCPTIPVALNTSDSFAGRPKKPDLDEKAKKHLELWLQFANGESRRRCKPHQLTQRSGRVASIRIYGHMLLVSQDVEHKTWKLVCVQS